MFTQHVGNQDADTAKSDNDCPLNLSRCGHRWRFAFTQLDALGHVVTNPGENWRDGKANRCCCLPKCGSFGADQLCGAGGGQYDQRRF